MRWTWRSTLWGVGIFLIGWVLLAAVVNRPILPYPWQVLPVFVEKFFVPASAGSPVVPDFYLPIPLGELGQHFLVSAVRVLTAIVVAVFFAAPIGLELGQIQSLNQLFSPLIGLLHPIPKIVFLPVILVLFGSGDGAKILLIALVLFFQILIVVRDEAAGLRPELIYSVRSLGAGRRALFRFVYIPASIPAILTALRISVGTAIAVLFIAETYATRSGLGYYIVVRTWQALRYPEMYAGIMAMALLGLVLYFVIDALERHFNRWRGVE
ncbi:MAG: ABC transporter permease [Anaerolineae bacterium]|nr:ABC transporter permease [Anaerolineae bacterium]